MLRRENNALVREYASETLVIEPWGKDSLRVRSTMSPFLDEQDWALLCAESSEEPKVSIGADGGGSITHGRITARIGPARAYRLLQPAGGALAGRVYASEAR